MTKFRPYINDPEHCQRLLNAVVAFFSRSALNLFGGKGIKYTECVRFNKGAGR